MAEASKPAAESESKSLEVSKGRSMFAWLVGWLLIPSFVVGGLFGAGVHVGARHPDMLLSRAVLWAAGAEASRAPATPEEAAPLSRQIYLLVLPTKEFGLQVEIDEEQLARLLDAGEAAAELDCKVLCERVWVEQHPDKEFVAARECSVEDEQTKRGTLACELEVER